VAAATLAGAIAGFLIMSLANVLSTSGPAGDGWSFRGNGALIVPFGLGPVVLAAGWTMFVLHGRSHPRWIFLGTLAGLLELAILAIGIAALVVGGSAVGTAVSAFAQPIQVLVMVAIPVVAAVIQTSASVHTRPSWSHYLSALALPIGLLVGFVVGGFFGS
jgi:hypothetical protein